MTDEELVEKFKNGDESVFDEIYARYKNAIVYYARTIYIIGADLEDVIQYGMMGLFKAVSCYNGKSSFKNFAFTCIKTSILSGAKKYLSTKNLPLNTAVGIEDYANRLTDCENAEDKVIDDEAFDQLMKRAKSVLSVFEYQVLELFLQGYSYTEIALKLNKTSKTCDNALQRIKKKLSGEN